MATRHQALIRFAMLYGALFSNDNQAPANPASRLLVVRNFTPERTVTPNMSRRLATRNRSRGAALAV
jgi:hypothetical protein